MYGPAQCRRAKQRNVALSFQVISYQVGNETLHLARRGVLFIRPLSAHHGEEISGELLDDQKALLDRIYCVPNFKGSGK